MKNQNIAVTLHFLMQGFWNYTDNENDLIGDEKDFVNECYDVAVAIEILNESIAVDRKRSGVYMYEVIEEVGGKILFDYIDGGQCEPLVLGFIEQFKPLIEKWYRPVGFFKVDPHKMHTIDRYKLSIWDGREFGCSYHYTVQEAEEMAEQVKTELLK